MFPKSEAQRVIAISLGKIATFRSQRGGCSLHKNLLVTNVLQKVRNFVNDDDHTVNWEHRYERTSSSETPLVTAVEDQTVISSFSENPHDKPNEVSSIPCSKRVRVAHSYDGIGLLEPRDAVNGCGMSSNSSSMSDSVFQQENEMCLPNSAFEYYHTIAENEKNSACEAAANSNFSRPESSARARCLKRRQSVEDDSTVCAKRPKFDLDQGVSHMSWRLQPAFSDSDSETEYDNIDSDPDSSASSQGDNTMDAEQICSLVSVFKCSFHGLGLIDGSAAGSCEDLLTSQDYKYQNSPTFIQELTMQTSREGKPHPLRRGMSLPDLCAKQADLLCQKFQQAAPVVALTV